MTELSEVQPSDRQPSQGYTSPIEVALDQALKQLAGIDSEHAKDVAAVSELVDAAMREMATRELEERYRRRREPHVLRLAELHQRLRFGTLLRQVH